MPHTFTHYTFTTTGGVEAVQTALGIHVAEPSPHGRAVWCLETPNGHLLQHPDENTIHVNWGGELIFARGGKVSQDPSPESFRE